MDYDELERAWSKEKDDPDEGKSEDIIELENSTEKLREIAELVEMVADLEDLDAGNIPDIIRKMADRILDMVEKDNPNQEDTDY